MKSIYRICAFGDTSRLTEAFMSELSEQLSEFELEVGVEVEVQIGSSTPYDGDSVATVGLFFGNDPVPDYVKPPALSSHHAVIPVVSNLSNCHKELPKEVSQYNAIARDGDGQILSIAAATLECLGLMPSRRRVFLSYRRTESRKIALQLYDDLSSRQFDVFLDTHEIRPGAIFQDSLWHQLCDSDVMLMLDTKSYFESRWTSEEFGKANLKKAAILRIGFPDVKRNKNLSVTDTIDLTENHFSAETLLLDRSLDLIGDSVERLRSKSVAVRQANLIGSYRTAVEQLKGTVEEPGRYRRLLTSFPNGKKITTYPAIGVPTSELVNRIADDAVGKDFGILYDNVGILKSWQTHLEWLGRRVDQFRWIRADNSAKELYELAQ